MFSLLGNALAYASLPNLSPNIQEEAPAVVAKIKTSAYASPEYHFQINETLRSSFTPCTAIRRDNFITVTHACSKIFIDSRGDILLESIQSLQERGWIKNTHGTRISPPTSKTSNHAKTDPDIKAVQGSCSLLKLSHEGEDFYVIISNDHVIYCAREEIESCSVSDYASDFNLIPLKIAFKTAEEKYTLPVATLPSSPITNAELPNREVEIVGVGGDLFKFYGKPFALPTTVKYPDGQTKQQTLFCLLTPHDFLHHSREIGGMSGSPVTIRGTKDIVGVLSSTSPFDSYMGIKSTALIFAGPDELNLLIQNNIATLWDIHNQAKSKK